jgi:hypothetical protein
LGFAETSPVQYIPMQDNDYSRHETQPEVPGEYEFIGECYVHGIMDGNALEIQKSHQLPKRRFILV